MIGYKFYCEGGALDDFECGTFVCEGQDLQYICEYSFDNEDCESSFTCASREFVCTGSDYDQG
jgi:hypothetical protein